MSKTLRVYDGAEFVGDFVLSPEQEAQLTPILPMLSNPAFVAMAAPMLRPALRAAIAEKKARGERLAREIDVDNFDLRLELIETSDDD